MTSQEKFDNVINHLNQLIDDVWTELDARCRTDITANEDKEYRFVKKILSKIEETVKEVCKNRAKRVYKNLENSNHSVLLNLLCVSGILEYYNMGEFYREAYEANPQYYLNPKTIKEILQPL